jgi:hypothetical protein
MEYECLNAIVFTSNCLLSLHILTLSPECSTLALRVLHYFIWLPYLSQSLSVVPVGVHYRQQLLVSLEYSSEVFLSMINWDPVRWVRYLRQPQQLVLSNLMPADANLILRSMLVAVMLLDVRYR